MFHRLRSVRAACGLVAAFALVASGGVAQEVNTSALSENGWYSDDTRADGTGTESAGTNLISDTLTDDPEATASGTSAHDADIQAQIAFGDAIGAEPAGTFGGAVHLQIGASGSGKSQISHRKDDGTGHGPGSGLDSGFTAEYSWMGDGTSTVTASLKFGIKTADFGSTGVSSRTGENVWDKVLIYEPGNLNGNTSDGLWHTETIDHTTGKWWFFDRTVGASIIGTPQTLATMSTNVTPFSGAKTPADVYALITAPGAHITSVQFGIGSGNAGGSVYVNEMTTSVYRAGMTTTFGTPSPYDQDITPDVLFGSGNLNGSFTVDRQNGVELALRGKLRYPPSNIFNSNGDGTYSFNPGVAPTQASPTAEWSFEWSINSNYDGSGGVLNSLTYQLGMDSDPGLGTNFTVLDVINGNNPGNGVLCWDHSTGTNSSTAANDDRVACNNAGTLAAHTASYAGFIGANNVAQNSWKPHWFLTGFDPNAGGTYDFYLAAFDNGVEVARTAIQIQVPEPGSLALVGLALAGLGFSRRRRQA